MCSHMVANCCQGYFMVLRIETSSIHDTQYLMVLRLFASIQNLIWVFPYGCARVLQYCWIPSNTAIYYCIRGWRGIMKRSLFHYSTAKISIIPLFQSRKSHYSVIPEKPRPLFHYSAAKISFILIPLFLFTPQYCIWDLAFICCDYLFWEAKRVCGGGEGEVRCGERIKWRGSQTWTPFHTHSPLPLSLPPKSYQSWLSQQKIV